MDVNPRHAAFGWTVEQRGAAGRPFIALPKERLAFCNRRGLSGCVGATSGQADMAIRVVTAHSEEQKALAWDLVARRYAWRGYRSSSASTAYPDPQRAPYYTTLLAYRSGSPVGTVTLGVDSEAGLLVDEVNKPEVDRIRAHSRRASELVRLAIDEGAESKQVWLALLEGLSLLCRRIYDLSDMLIEVNPRHVVFYRRVFGFRVIAPLRECARVGAPSVLMRLTREVLEARLQGVRWPLVESVRAGVDALTGTASVAQTAEAA
jgi:hypothetical protein